MKKRPLLRQTLLFSALLAPLAVRATTATTLSDFGGIEEPEVIYHPGTGTFTNDSYQNITNPSPGVFQVLLRYSTSQWDGDRTTSNTDRQRGEVKTLGPDQMKGDTYLYTTTWRTNPEFTGSGAFCHITQLKPVDGVEGSSGAPLITTSIFAGTSSAAVRYASASFSPANVFSPQIVRNITWSPNTWLAEQIKVKTTGDGQTTGFVLVSLNGDSFQGVSNVEVCRPSSTEYYPKWGLYRGVSTTSGFFANDYVQHSNVTCGPASSTPQTADPIFSPAAGTYTSAQNVTITSDTSGASIRYTTDGSTPSETAGTIYSGPVRISSTTTLNAIAYASGFIDSNVASGAYTINPPPQAAAPVFSPAAGTYPAAQNITITSSTAGASIRYTTDGSTPSETAGTLYSGAITISSNTTLKAIAYETGFTDSTVTSGTYTINILTPAAAPVFSPAAGTYSTAQNITITSSTSGASIRYTTDGSTPSETTGTLYSGPVNISNTASPTTLKAIAYASGFTDSSVTSGTYTITTGGNPVTVTLEAESLSPVGTGATVSTSSDTNASGGVVEFLNSTATGQAMTLTTPGIVAATYQVQLRYKPNTSRGQLTVKIDGAQVGGTIDEYATNQTYVTATLGNATIASGTHTIVLTVTGKNSASSGYLITADSFTFTPVTAPPPTLNFEAESLGYTASGATASIQTDTNSSGGKWVELAGNSTGDNISFTVPNVPAGTYQLKMEWKGNNSRGILQLSVDGTNLGSTLDQYAAAQSYPTTTFGNVTFASAGNHTVRLTVTGKNSKSSSYQLSADRFTLVGQ